MTWRPLVKALRDEAVAVAAKADLIVAFLGLTAGLKGEEMRVDAAGFKGGDRTTLELPDVQRRLLQSLQSTGKPVVIVGVSGSALALGEADRQAGAVVQAWYGGEAGGQAIGEVLSRHVNPSGRLPVTFYASTDQLPPFEDYSMKGRTYRYFAGTPAYAFGHGLSYSRFGYQGLAVKPTVRAGQALRVAVTVRNDGAVAGDEVAQLYLEPVGRPDLPRRSLKGFERVRLAPGESRSVEFALQPRDLAFADAKGVTQVEAGTYRLWTGGGQEGTGAPGVAATLRVTGRKIMPR